MTENHATEPNPSDGLLTGRCRSCEWYVVERSYAKVVKSYQDHLRKEHPERWLRG